MNLYISDLHFGHKNVIRFDNRPFDDVDEMDEFVMNCWNNRVSDDDTVYILGDICYHSKKGPEWYLNRLKGKKVLIYGNHDKKILSDERTKRQFEQIDNMLTIKDGDNDIVLCHYPIAEWDGFFRGAWHIYGHIHSKKGDTFDIVKKFSRALNAGCMINNYTPVSFEELVRNNEAFKSLD